MQENKPTSSAIIVVTLLCMFHTTLIMLLISMGLNSFDFIDARRIFLYGIDYILPITFLVSILNSVRIDDNIFLKKRTRWFEDTDDCLIIRNSSFSLVISFVVILVFTFLKNADFRDIGIFILHIIIFGGFFVFLISMYIILPLMMIINMLISLLTNWIFNIMFAKHLKTSRTPLQAQAQTQSHKKTRRGNNARK